MAKEGRCKACGQPWGSTVFKLEHEYERHLGDHGALIVIDAAALCSTGCVARYVGEQDRYHRALQEPSSEEE
jgi:hypothetical protein